MVAYKRMEEEQRREAEEKARIERERIEAEARAKAQATNKIEALIKSQQAKEAEAQALEAQQAAEQAIREGAMAKHTVVVEAPPKVTAAGTSFRKTWKFRTSEWVIRYGTNKATLTHTC